MQFNNDIGFSRIEDTGIAENYVVASSKKDSEAQNRDAIRYRRVPSYVSKPTRTIHCYRLPENSNEIRIIGRAAIYMSRI